MYDLICLDCGYIFNVDFFKRTINYPECKSSMTVSVVTHMKEINKNMIITLTEEVYKKFVNTGKEIHKYYTESQLLEMLIDEYNIGRNIH